MSDEKKLKILKALKAGKIDRDQAIGLMDMHGIEYKKQVPKEDVPGIGSQALDMGMRALDYTAGLGRVSAAGLSELVSLGESGVTRSDDIMRALKGEAPTTEEYLERSGMEEGALRTGLGFVGDVALDPATYLSGGTAAAAKIPRLAKVLTAADKLTEIPLKGIAKGYKGLTRGIAPQAASAISGVDESALKSYLKNPKAAQLVSEQGEESVANEKLFNAWDKVQDSKAFLGKRINEEIRESGKMVDVSNVKDKLQKNITDLYNTPGLSSAEVDYLNDLKQLKEDLFTAINPKTGDSYEVRDLVDASTASRIKDTISGMGDLIKDPATIKKSTDKRKLKILRALGAETSGSINKAIPEGSEIKREYADVLRDEKFLSENFKNKKSVDPKFDVDAFDKKGLRTLAGLNTTKMSGISSKVDAFDQKYGTNLIEDSKSIKASRQLVNPSWIPVSGQGVVSTGRIALSSALGAGAMSQMEGDTRTGAALGLGLGALLAGPKAMRRMSKAAYGTEKLITPALQSVPTSAWRRMVINGSRSEER